MPVDTLAMVEQYPTGEFKPTFLENKAIMDRSNRGCASSNIDDKSVGLP